MNKDKRGSSALVRPLDSMEEEGETEALVIYEPDRDTHSARRSADACHSLQKHSDNKSNWCVSEKCIVCMHTIHFMY